MLSEQFQLVVSLRKGDLALSNQFREQFFGANYLFQAKSPCFIAQSAVIGAYPAVQGQRVDENRSILFSEAEYPTRKRSEEIRWDVFVHKPQGTCRNRLLNSRSLPVSPDLLCHNLRRRQNEAIDAEKCLPTADLQEVDHDGGVQHEQLDIHDEMPRAAAHS